MWMSKIAKLPIHNWHKAPVWDYLLLFKLIYVNILYSKKIYMGARVMLYVRVGAEYMGKYSSTTTSTWLLRVQVLILLMYSSMSTFQSTWVQVHF